MGAVRIGKIRLKSGGAEVRLLRQDLPNHDGEENWAGKLIAGARGAAEWVEKSGPITGYVMVAFYQDNSTFVSYRWGGESPFNRCLLPGYVAEVIRRDVIIEDEVCDAVNRAHGFED